MNQPDSRERQIEAIVEFFENRLDGQVQGKPWLPHNPLPRKYEGWTYGNILRELIQSHGTQAAERAVRELAENANELVSAFAYENKLNGMKVVNVKDLKRAFSKPESEGK